MTQSYIAGNTVRLSVGLLVLILMQLDAILTKDLIRPTRIEDGKCYWQPTTNVPHDWNMLSGGKWTCK